MANSSVHQSKWKPIVEPRRAKPKTYHQAPTYWLQFYEEAIIESEARRPSWKTIFLMPISGILVPLSFHFQSFTQLILILVVSLLSSKNENNTTQLLNFEG